jgi:hypothetical protein
MNITEHAIIRSQLAGYVAFALVALATLYFASLGPGVPQAELAIATALP